MLSALLIVTLLMLDYKSYRECCKTLNNRRFLCNLLILSELPKIRDTSLYIVWQYSQLFNYYEAINM